MLEQDVGGLLTLGLNRLTVTAFSDGSAPVPAIDDGMVLTGRFGVREGMLIALPEEE